MDEYGAIAPLGILITAALFVGKLLVFGAALTGGTAGRLGVSTARGAARAVDRPAPEQVRASTHRPEPSPVRLPGLTEQRCRGNPAC
ncbi:MAG: hypothetical protein JWP48_274 [Actinoallomurus sp.]|jgi:hypothetical protein|nr:hypothetical protein [Actinoallomurus sp.]